jgi:hypothetical protein
VKWCLKQEGTRATPRRSNYKLAGTGPRSAILTSKNTTRPSRIDSVYLFDARTLVAEQQTRGVMAGIAASFRMSQWNAAKIYPSPHNRALPLSQQQISRLKPFAF